MDSERLEKQISFLREIDQDKEIVRQTYLASGNRKETDSEHAWHMAVMTLVLSEYANEKIDVLRTISMLLLHDLVEVYAGDTYAYDEEGKKSQAEREQKSADRLYAMLPEDQGKYLKNLWKEFEEGVSPEARFARTLDNFQPTMLNDASGGKSWREKGVALHQILDRNKNSSKGSQVLWDYSLNNFIMPHVKSGDIRED